MFLPDAGAIIGAQAILDGSGYASEDSPSGTEPAWSSSGNGVGWAEKPAGSEFAVKVLGMLLAAVPFGFAMIRLFSTGDDTRYLWMAVVSTLCAAGVLVRPGSRVVPSRARIGVATIAAGACAAAAGIVLGAREASAIAIVAGAFGLCSAFGTGLVISSRGWGNLPAGDWHERR